MKVSNIISPLYDILFVLRTAFVPTIAAVLSDPTLLLRWSAFLKVLMSIFWVEFGDGVDQKAREAKMRLLCTPKNAPEGVVLDLGAGHGHTMKYLDRTRVKCYIALEPNELMHPFIRGAGNEAGYTESDGSLVIISCGVEDTAGILSCLASAGVVSSTSTPGQSQPVDTIISILTLCSVPDLQRTLRNLVRDVLKPGGVFFMYEHVLNPREDVRRWQRFWAPLWALFFAGCRMDRATDVVLKNLEVECGDGADTKKSAWREWISWGNATESEETLFWHSGGRFVKT